jgi:hypothetical protein
MQLPRRSLRRRSCSFAPWTGSESAAVKRENPRFHANKSSPITSNDVIGLFILYNFSRYHAPH